jgi:hypothetical protein
VVGVPATGGAAVGRAPAGFTPAGCAPEGDPVWLSPPERSLESHFQEPHPSTVVMATESTVMGSSEMEWLATGSLVMVWPVMGSRVERIPELPAK